MISNLCNLFILDGAEDLFKIFTTKNNEKAE